MNYGSSEEETSEEEARAQDRRGEEDDGEEDGYRPSQDRQKEIVAKRRGASSPRLLYFPFQNNLLRKRARPHRVR